MNFFPRTITLSFLAFSLFVGTTKAQVNDLGLRVPTVPGCAPGYSWTKNGVRFQCMTPAPSCQYGFSSGPVWSGSSWSYSCNGAPAPPPPSTPTNPPPTQVDPNAACISFMSQRGYSPYGYGARNYNCSAAHCLDYPTVNGPPTRDGTQCDNVVTKFEFQCAVDGSGNVVQAGAIPLTSCGGQGG
jgi:hypothetical protein